jgi:hypothetical protein
MSKFLQTYKKNLLQVLGISIAGYVTKNAAFYYVAACLLLILLFFPAFSLLLVQYTDKFLYLIANLFKRILLAVLFIIFITPLACIMRLLERKKNGPAYISRLSDFQPTDMRKMW